MSLSIILLVAIPQVVPLNEMLLCCNCHPELRPLPVEQTLYFRLRNKHTFYDHFICLREDILSNLKWNARSIDTSLLVHHDTHEKQIVKLRCAIFGMTNYTRKNHGRSHYSEISETLAPLRNVWTMTQERDNGNIIRKNSNKRDVANNKLCRSVTTKIFNLAEFEFQQGFSYQFYTKERITFNILPLHCKKQVENHVQEYRNNPLLKVIGDYCYHTDQLTIRNGQQFVIKVGNFVSVNDSRFSFARLDTFLACNIRNVDPEDGEIPIDLKNNNWIPFVLVTPFNFVPGNTLDTWTTLPLIRKLATKAVLMLEQVIEMVFLLPLRVNDCRGHIRDMLDDNLVLLDNQWLFDNHQLPNNWNIPFADISPQQHQSNPHKILGDICVIEPEKKRKHKRDGEPKPKKKKKK